MTAFDPAAPRIFAGNDFRDLPAAKTFEVIDPASLEVVGRDARCTAADVEAVVAEASAAQRA